MKNILLVLVSVSMCVATYAKPKIEVNYDESKILPYSLPNILEANSVKVDNAFDWLEKCAPSIRESLLNDMFGQALPRPSSMQFETIEQAEALDGIAIRKQIKITLKDKLGEKSFIMLLHYPKDAAQKNKKYPVFIGMNFLGNHTLDKSKEILVSPYRKDFTKKSADSERGIRVNRWDLKYIISQGYAVASCYYIDIYYDREKHFKDSIYAIYEGYNQNNAPAIVAWSYGYSRMFDCLETLSEIDTTKAIAIGHSRLGKTALMTGVLDKRFAMIISNNSGCMGAALSRRNIGETIKHITSNFPYWFSPRLNNFTENPDLLKIDAHQFMALIAPKPLYVASATEDIWADPKGELMSLVETAKVYKLLGAKDLPTMANYEVEKPFIGDLGYHLRKGKHDLTKYDWVQYIKFANKHLLNK